MTVEARNWATEAKEQLQAALSAVDDPAATSDEVLSAIGLAELAYRILVGDTAADEWPEDDEPECICPPELVERGGFKGGCPVHGIL